MILQGDALTVLKTLPSESVNMCVTSPPYYALRDYGVDGQIGLEDTPEQYIERLVGVFHEVKRVLRDDGTLWVNIGDSYSGSGKGGANYPDSVVDSKQATNKGSLIAPLPVNTPAGTKPKDLIGIPWMLAFALRADGWYLRQDIIWQKPNPMPESVTDRCTKSHEYIFLLSKSPHYFFDHDAMKEEAVSQDTRASALQRARDLDYNTKDRVNPDAYRIKPTRYGGKKYTETPDKFYRTKSGNAYDYTGFRNKRDVWCVATVPYAGAHFATFPEKLIEPCVLSSTKVGGGSPGLFFWRRNHRHCVRKARTGIYRNRVESRIRQTV